LPSERVREQAEMLLLDLVMPNGKALRQCTVEVRRRIKEEGVSKQAAIEEVAKLLNVFEHTLADYYSGKVGNLRVRENLRIKRRRRTVARKRRRRKN
jgi:hypothetical protein